MTGGGLTPDALRALEARLRELLAMATPGRWRAQTHEGCKSIGVKSGKKRQDQYSRILWTSGLANEEEDAANAELVTETRNALPALLDALAQQATALATAREGAGALRALLGETVKSITHDQWPPDFGAGDRCKPGCSGCMEAADRAKRIAEALKDPTGVAP